MKEGFIKRVCEMYGMTQKELAQELDIPIRTVENWACRDSCPAYVRSMIYDTLKHRLQRVAIEEVVDFENARKIWKFTEENRKRYMQIAKTNW